MSDDNKEPEEEPEAVDETAEAPEDLIAAEGPDVETSFSDEDLAFLAGDRIQQDGAAELLVDLKRVQAEFANYRKRVDRERESARDANVAEVVKAMLPVLDDLALAESHGDLTEGPMLVIAQKFRARLEKFGLVAIGEKGDVFDPNLHEAIVQLPTPGADVNTVADVITQGYKIGDRLLRPAKVAVSVPEE